jgi:hypothetical protein
MSYSANTIKKPEGRSSNVERPKIDPSLIRIAKQAYRDYLETAPYRAQPPLGIVVNRSDGRCKVVYNQLILLPHEVFVPIELIDH